MIKVLIYLRKFEIRLSYVFQFKLSQQRRQTPKLLILIQYLSIKSSVAGTFE